MKQLIIMNVKEITIDSIKYPFIDWKKILILGLIVVIYKIPLNMFPLSLTLFQDQLDYSCIVLSVLITDQYPVSLNNSWR